MLALVAAGTAGQRQEVPVGAVLRDAAGRFLGECGNNTVAAVDPTGHAELRALRQGAVRMGSYRLLETTLTVTLEPCTMCRSALLMARVKRVIFEAKSSLSHAITEFFPVERVADMEGCLFEGNETNQQVNAPVFLHFRGPEADAGRLLRIFFEQRRNI